MIEYSTLTTDNELRQIIALQTKNLEASLLPKSAQSDGFVFVVHDFDLLKAMNKAYPHQIAKQGDKVIGYALVMLCGFEDRIPLLVPLVHQIRKIRYAGEKLSELSFFIMGQACIEYEYRGCGVFASLFTCLKNRMQKDFQYIVTEVAARNGRSLKAHQNVGFIELHEYKDDQGENWKIILWDWRD